MSTTYSNSIALLAVALQRTSRQTLGRCGALSLANAACTTTRPAQQQPVFVESTPWSSPGTGGPPAGRWSSLSLPLLLLVRGYHRRVARHLSYLETVGDGLVPAGAFALQHRCAFSTPAAPSGGQATAQGGWPGKESAVLESQPPASAAHSAAAASAAPDNQVAPTGGTQPPTAAASCDATHGPGSEGQPATAPASSSPAAATATVGAQAAGSASSATDAGEVQASRSPPGGRQAEEAAAKPSHSSEAPGPVEPGPGVQHTFTLVETKLPPLVGRRRSAAEQACLKAALAVVAKLNYAGFEGMFAGGWVRDQFLSRPSADIDLVTNATLTDMVDLFGRTRCSLKGGNTCDVTWEGHTFEVTSYRGGLHNRTHEAEYRDAACRDFTINALFFRPQSASRAAPPDLSRPRRPGSNISAATTVTTFPLSTSSAPAAGAPAAAADAKRPPAARRGPPGSPRGNNYAWQQARDSVAPSVLVSNHLQPAGWVRDYVGGVADIQQRVLRVYPHHLRLGYKDSSVEADPVRALRAARLSVELGLRVDSYTQTRIRRAARVCVLGANGVTANRVFRELSKMAELDNKVENSSSSGGGGGGKGSGGSGSVAAGPAAGKVAAGVVAVDGGPGSPRFARALEMCRQWRVLEALFPGLPQTFQAHVIATVIPRLPAALPVELKLSCLVAGGRETCFPWSDPAKYQPIKALLTDTRLAQSHWPDLLCLLSHLVVDDIDGDRRERDWVELLAAEGAGDAEKALLAFVDPDNGWRDQLAKRLAEHRAKLATQIADAKEKKQNRRSAAAAAAVR